MEKSSECEYCEGGECLCGDWEDVQLELFTCNTENPELCDACQ